MRFKYRVTLTFPDEVTKSEETYDTLSEAFKVIDFVMGIQPIALQPTITLTRTLEN